MFSFRDSLRRAMERILRTSIELRRCHSVFGGLTHVGLPFRIISADIPLKELEDGCAPTRYLCHRRDAIQIHTLAFFSPPAECSGVRPNCGFCEKMDDRNNLVDYSVPWLHGGLCVLIRRDTRRERPLSSTQQDGHRGCNAGGLSGRRQIPQSSASRQLSSALKQLLCWCGHASSSNRI